MHKIPATIISFLLLVQIHAQEKKKISVNIDLHINSTLYDRTLSNNGTGFGLALQTRITTNTKFTPTIEIASDVYGGTRQLFITMNGKPIYSKSSITTVVAGAMFKVNSKLYLGNMLGAGFFNGKTYFTMKPLIEYQFWRNRIITRLAFVNIFQHDEISQQSFGYISVGAGIKLF